MTMGRKSKTNQLGLDPKKHARLYPKHGAFYYVHKDNRWERLGADLAEAKAKAEHYNDATGTFGTMTYWLDEFVLYCEKSVGLSKAQRGLAQRTYEDYKKDVAVLKDFFGAMLPSQVQPFHVAQYLDIGAQDGRPVRANREKSCLSAAFSWMLRQPDSGIKLNPCVGIKRNPEQKRERYVEDAEFNAVYAITEKPVRAFMDLTYRTLQRPENIMNWTSKNITTKIDQGTKKRVIRTKQGKTGADLDIEITPEIDAVLQSLYGTLGPFFGMPLIHTKKGKPYTYSGLCSMLQRYRKKAKVENFGFYDLKGKGATAMLLSGVSLEKIQVLCGHESVTTTEIYVKCRWRGTVTPNQVQMAS
ncbi:tyrosine recombinase XerC [Herbaspirillum sp. GCM10030257]|uniref:site-specific integrase n=1 Tax=Herbaspirillum sp. GCM10030257 TaxID=3273393 RepID=UPI0036069A22